MKVLHGVTFLLTVVGALNWGLVGLLDFNLVNAVLGSMPTVEMVVYVLVGLSLFIYYLHILRIVKFARSSVVLCVTQNKVGRSGLFLVSTIESK